MQQVSELGANPKLDELMVLVAVAAATESGDGCDLEVLKRHAQRAAELWNTLAKDNSLSQDEVERVARAIDPEAWQRHADMLKFAKEPPPGIPADRHEASCQRLAERATETSLTQARAAIAALVRSPETPITDDVREALEEAARRFDRVATYKGHGHAKSWADDCRTALGKTGQEVGNG